MIVDARAFIRNPTQRRLATAATQSSNATFTALSDLSLALPLGTWKITGALIVRSAAATTGIQLSTATSTIVASLFCGFFRTAVSTTVVNQQNFVAVGTPAAFTAMAVTNVDQLLEIEIIVTVTTAGNFNLQFRSEVNASQVTVQPQSWIQYEPISQNP